MLYAIGLLMAMLIGMFYAAGFLTMAAIGVWLVWPELRKHKNLQEEPNP